MTDDDVLPAAVPAPPVLLRGRLVTDRTIIDDGVLAAAAGRIVYAGPADGFQAAASYGGGLDAGTFAAAERTDLPADRLILPGLVDIHNHGGNGGDFPGGDETAARRAIDFLHRSGTTTLLASMVTASTEDLLKGIRLFVRLSREGLIAGTHLEGPFLSHARCGAQDPQWLREPDPELLERLIAAGEGTIATMTCAPELPGANRLADELARNGIIPSLGHTDCDDATAAAFLERSGSSLAAAGSRRRPTVTHLFNGMPPMHHRAPGPVAACLRAAHAGSAAVELVADNTHLDPATVRTVFDLVDAANVVLVTDSMAAAGLSDGRYMLGPAPVTVLNSVATLDSTGSIAGGTATLLDVVRRTAAAGVPLADAAYAATAVPAAVLGLSDEVGSLRAGARADAVVVDAELHPAAVLRGGQWLPPAP